MTPQQFLESLDKLDLLQCLIWGEARGETLEGKIGVACVVMNRVKEKPWRGDDWSGVMLRPRQFSCFNLSDPNLLKIVTGYQADRWGDAIWRMCRWIAHGVIYNWVPDNTNGANHYCNADSDLPYWAEGKTPIKIIGNHNFYRL